MSFVGLEYETSSSTVQRRPNILLANKRFFVCAEISEKTALGPIEKVGAIEPLLPNNIKTFGLVV